MKRVNDDRKNNNVDEKNDKSQYDEGTTRLYSIIHNVF